jgi:hypothetical protein
MLRLQDICNELNCHIQSMCNTEESLRDYEEKLLDKCFDPQYPNIVLGQTTMYYEPPFCLDIKNNQDM